MVERPVTSGTFDAELSPVVEICALDGDACAAGRSLVETFTTDGSGSARVRVSPADEHYIVNWHMREYDLTGSSHYRISVFAGPGILLGYADVEPVTNGRALKNVDTGQYIGLVDNRTLPIKFRVETGFAAGIDIEPSVAVVTVGQTRQFIGTVTDLHGNVLVAAVAWTSEDGGVASVDGDGLATGLGPGTTTITGTVDHLGASAVLTVEPEVEETGWAQVSAGGDHTCALATNGEALCWGLSSFGQLGNGGTGILLTPAAVAGNHAFASISAGLAHTCALTTAGEALCWGLSSFGQIGIGTMEAQLTPTTVAGNHRFASISAGHFHTCAVTTDGDALCWGAGTAGKLGYGGTDHQLTPIAVGGNHRFAAISAGSHFTCGLTTTGDALCWGEAFFGQLGNGIGPPNFQPSPVAVLGGHTFASIASGQSHTCGVTTAGATYCWGDSSKGQLGYGGTSIRGTPVAVLGGHEFASLDAGRAHTCGVTTAGAGYCWGLAGLGQVGYGGTVEQLSPVAVAGGHPFASISAGGFHSCGLTTAGEAHCWGRAHAGQLGDGATVNRFVPVRASDPF